MKRFLHLFLSLTLFITSLTVLYLGMREVMMIGGSCADGGPYVSARPCPKNVGWLMPLSVWVGFGAAAWYFYARSKFKAGPEWGYLFWSALFISLGYNFFEFGFFHPMTDEIIWGNVISAIVFFLMGAGPLFTFIDPSIGGWRKLLQLFTGYPLSIKHQALEEKHEDSWIGIFILHLISAFIGIFFASRLVL